MAYNKSYYDERKIDLEEQFNKSKIRAFQQMINIVNLWNEEASEINKKYAALNQRQAEEEQKTSSEKNSDNGGKNVK